MRRRALTLACAAALAPLVAAGAPEPPAVVSVRVWPASGPAQRATGVVVAPGRVLTVDHVLDAGRRIEVRAADGRRRMASVLVRRRGPDLAILRVPGATGAQVRLAHPDEDLRVLVERRGDVRAQAAVVRRRIVARLVDQPGRPRRPSLELATAVGAGDSGAPVVDRDGALVAIVYARSTRHDRAAYAVYGAGLRALAR